MGVQYSAAGPGNINRNDILKIMHKDRFHGTIKKPHLFAQLLYFCNVNGKFICTAYQQVLVPFCVLRLGRQEYN